ncbi:MAG: TetR-like C-terminal domain-containing protein [Stackebrandtia sp.]
MSAESARPARAARSADRIKQVTRDLLAERGYARLAIEAVAAAAGVGKTTVYRWWPDKETLVADALAETFRADEIPDLGDTAAELRLAVDMTLDNYAGDSLARALPALAAEGERDAGLSVRFREMFLAGKRKNVAAALRRGIARGDLPDDLDTDLVQDIWAGTIFYRRILSGGVLDDDLAERLTRLVLDSPQALRRAQSKT